MHRAFLYLEYLEIVRFFHFSTVVFPKQFPKEKRGHFVVTPSVGSLSRSYASP